jgi:hypothetical protein
MQSWMLQLPESKREIFRRYMYGFAAGFAAHYQMPSDATTSSTKQPAFAHRGCVWWFHKDTCTCLTGSGTARCVIFHIFQYSVEFRGALLVVLSSASLAFCMYGTSPIWCAQSCQAPCSKRKCLGPCPTAFLMCRPSERRIFLWQL